MKVRTFTGVRVTDKEGRVALLSVGEHELENHVAEAIIKARRGVEIKEFQSDGAPDLHEEKKTEDAAKVTAKKPEKEPEKIKKMEKKQPPEAAALGKKN